MRHLRGVSLRGLDLRGLDIHGLRRRRKSSLNWAQSTSRSRQEYYEEQANHYLADTWFSLHGLEHPEPFYVSEVVSRSANVDYDHFDLNTLDARITRQNAVILKLWVQPVDQHTRLFLEISLQLSKLVLLPSVRFLMFFISHFALYLVFKNHGFENPLLVSQNKRQ